GLRREALVGVLLRHPRLTSGAVEQLPPPRPFRGRGRTEGRRLLRKVHVRTEVSTNGSLAEAKISRRVRTCTPSSASGSTKVGTKAIPIPFLRVGENV